MGVGTAGFYGLPQPRSGSGMRRQQLPLCSCLTGCLCSSLLTASQNASEAGDQTPQLLPGEGDRSLPQAGMYGCETGVAPRGQVSPPPLHALLSCSLSSPCSCSPSRTRRLLAHRTQAGGRVRRARICLCKAKWVKTRYVPQKSSLCCDVKLLWCTGTLGGLWSKKDRRDCLVEAFLGAEQVEDRVTLGENTALS